jgi:hypothetical protein
MLGSADMILSSAIEVGIGLGNQRGNQRGRSSLILQSVRVIKLLRPL